MSSRFISLSFTLGFSYLEWEKKTETWRIQTAEFAGVREIDRIDIYRILNISDKVHLISSARYRPCGMRSLREVYPASAFCIEKYHFWPLRFILVIKPKVFPFVCQVAKTSARTENRCIVTLNYGQYRAFRDVCMPSFVCPVTDNVNIYNL